MRSVIYNEIKNIELIDLNILKRGDYGILVKKIMILYVTWMFQLTIKEIK